MTHYDLVRSRGVRYSGGDALRAALLVLLTVLAGLAIERAIPDATQAELTAASAADTEVWLGNSALSRTAR